MNRILSRFALLIAALLWVAEAVAPACAADAAAPLQTAADVNGRVVNLGLNKSMVIDLPGEIRDVLVSNPQVADAVIRSNRKVYLIGMSVGETNIFLFGAGNAEIARFELVVGRDTVGLESTIASVIPNASIHARSLGDSVVLSGTAPSAEAANLAADIAGKFIGSPEKVVNSISISGSDQVNLRVVIAEIEKNTVQNLGIDMTGYATDNGITFFPVSTPSTSTSYNFAEFANRTISGTSTGSAIYDITKGSTSGAIGFATRNFAAMLDALKTQGVVRTLAEPNLTAISGQPAKFVVGGEIPYSTTDKDGNVVIQFKDYGIILKFTPVVLSTGRISLNINTEVSDIDATISSTVPALTKRSAETTVELPSGGAIALGGLLRDNVTKQLSGYPALSNVPILGTLFKSQSYKRQQTELVIFVTPYLVKPVPAAAMTRPDKNLNFRTDSAGFFLHQISKIYSTSGQPAKGSYQGRYGFSYE